MNAMPDSMFDYELGPDALAPEDWGCEVRAGGSVSTRCKALAELLADPGLRKQIGSAWPLYLQLVLASDGSVEGTRDEIAARIGADGRNVSNWVDRFVNAGIATVAKDKRRMVVKLVNRHMEVARMPDSVTIVDDGHDDDRKLDEKQKQVLRLYDDVRAMGGKIRITTEMDA